MTATTTSRAGYVDASSFLGEWPSRRLNGTPPPPREALPALRLALMDRLTIRRAAVSLLDAVWLKDSGVANAELHALLQSAGGDRFFPVYTLNPTFPTWREHLAACRDEYGLAPGTGAVRLLPAYHGYAAALPDAATPLLEELERADIPVLLTLQLEDARMQHPGMRVPDLKPDAAAALVARHPGVRWTITGGLFAQIQAIARAVPAGARAWFDIARVQGPVDCIRLLAGSVGAQRLLFSTHLPLDVPHSPMMELADARLSPEDDAAVRYANAAEALGITLAS